MAQNDIIDIDELIDANIDLSQPIPPMAQQPDPMTIKPGVYGEETPGQFVPSDFKNYLVDKLNISPNIIDKVLGQPYGFRDRFINLNPKDAIRDLFRGTLPGDQPLKEGQQPFGLNMDELFNPTDPATKRAEAAGINPKEGASFQVQKDASYLPADNYERGIKVLLKEAYPNVPLDALELATEPRTGRVVYKDPESGEKQFVQPPGVDWADVSAVMEPVMLEIAGGVAGFVAGNTAGRVQGGLTGGTAGLVTTAQLTDSEFFQGVGAATGTVLGALNPTRPVTFTLAGEALSHYLWRSSNLRGMKDRGILDETYTPDKIAQVAMKDAGLVTAFSAGGGAAFNMFARFLGRNPASVLGIDRDSFIKAYDEVEGIKTGGSKAEQEAVEDLTTPQVLGFSEDATPIRRQAMQKEVDESVSTRAEVEQRMIDQQTGFDLGYEKIFDEVGIDPNILIVPDVTKIKQTFGRDIGGYFDPEDVSTKAGKGVNPTDRKAMANKITDLTRGADPEGVFDVVWREGKLTNTQTFLDMMPSSKVNDFKTLIYRDFIDSTKAVDGNFNPNAIQVYLNKHTDGLKAVYGEEFVNGLRSYNKLIKDINIIAGKEGLPENQVIELANSLARAYLGIFTRPGRVITAGTKLTSKSRKATFENMILNPEILYNRIMREKLLSDPKFYDTARAIARAYDKSGGTDPEQPLTNFPVQSRVIEELDIEGLEMNMGGNPLIELQYGYGDN
tara:strand:+ start:2463 stop:4649 length:2187 start_codon:yes stop_codon:yes gene_type:complete